MQQTIQTTKGAWNIDLDLIVFETIRAWHQKRIGPRFFYKKTDHWWSHLQKAHQKWMDEQVASHNIPEHPLPEWHAITLLILEGYGASIPVYCLAADRKTGDPIVDIHVGDLTLDRFITVLAWYADSMQSDFQRIIDGTCKSGMDFVILNGFFTKLVDQANEF